MGVPGERVQGFRGGGRCWPGRRDRRWDVAHPSLHTHLKAQVVASGHRFLVKRFQGSVATWLVSDLAGSVRKSLGVSCRRKEAPGRTGLWLEPSEAKIKGLSLVPRGPVCHQNHHE